MDKENNENFTVEDLLKEQIQISKITIILNFVFIVFVLLLNLGKSIILGIISGCLVSIAFHWMLFNDLRVAIRMDKDSAVSYANLHSVIRKILFILVLVFLVANKWVKVNVIGLIIGLLSFRFVLYFYNLIKLRNKK